MPGWRDAPEVKPGGWRDAPLAGEPVASHPLAVVSQELSGLGPPLVEHPEYDPGTEMGRGLSSVQNRVDDALARAREGSSSSPVGEARKSLQLARDLDLGSQVISGRTKDFEQAQQREAVGQKLSSLPRLAAYMARSPQHAAALSGEVDHWGVLEYVFGRGRTYVGDLTAREKALELIEPGYLRRTQPDRPSYVEPPPWLLSVGRATWSMIGSIQDQMEAKYGPKKDEGPSTETIKKRRELGSVALPGDEHPVYGKLNAVAGMLPITVASMANPMVGLAVLHEETAGRVYEDMRLQGYRHEQASQASEVIGFTTTAVAAAMGPLFKLKLIPKQAIEALGSLPAAMAQAMSRAPSAWRFVWDLGKNFFANTAMNVAMAASEHGVREAYDSARAGRPYDPSIVVSKSAQAAQSWAEMLALSVVPAYEAHAQRSAARPLREAATDADRVAAEREKLAMEIHDNYEERGQALRSMHEASKLVAAVEAVKQSTFMQENPQDAQELIKQMVAPRETQTVFVAPEAVMRLDPDSLARLGFPELSLGEAGLVPINIVSWLMHPEVESLLAHTAGEADLLPVGEAGRFDTAKNLQDRLQALMALRDFTTANEPETPERRAKLNSIVEEMRSVAAQMPLPEEPGTARQPPRDPPPPKPPAAPRQPEAPEGQRALRAWADDVVSRRPSAELLSMAQQHEARADERAREALSAQYVATEHARAGREGQAGEAGDAATEARRGADISGALHKSARSAIEEVKRISEGLAKMGSEEVDKSGLTPRQRAWWAGAEYGEAHDAIMEMLGVAPKRGYAASDLVDIYVKLAREQKLAGQQFDGWDLPGLNRLLRDQQEVGNLSLAELREVNRAMTQISASADAENTVRVHGTRVAISMMREQVAEHLANVADVPRSQQITADSPKALEQVEGNLAKVGKKVAGVKAILNQPHTLLFKLGKVGESLWFEGFVTGVARENRMWGDVEGRLRGIRADVPEEITKSGRDVVPGLGKSRDGGPVLKLRSDAWHMMLHLGVEGADVKIARGLGVEVTQLYEWLHQNLGRTPEEAHAVMEKLITPHWRLFDSIWPEYEQHFKERGIAPPEKLKAKKVTIWDREFQGGYGGRLKWLDLSEGKAVLHPGSLEALLASDARGPATENRHLIERDPSFGGVPVLNWDEVVGSVRKEIHDIAMRPFVEDAHKVFSDGEMREVLARKMGKDALNQIFDPRRESSWLHVVARGSVADVHTAQAFTRAVMKLQGYAAYAAFSLNVRVMFGQLSHAFAAMPGLGIMPDHMAMGVHAAFDADRRAWAHGASEVLRLRYNDYEARAVEMNRQITGVEQGKRLDQRATDHLNWMAWREMDGFLSHAIWEAAYAKATAKWRLGEGADHEVAVREADKAVTKMMPAQDVYDQAAFVRDRSVAGLFYMVKNFPVTLANVSAMNWWEARVSDRPFDRTKVIARYVGMVLAAGALGEGYMMRGGIPEGKDPLEWWAEHAIGALLYPFMLREPGLAAYHALRGERTQMRQELNRMTPAAFSVVGQGIDDVGRFFQDGDDEAALRAGAHLSGLLLKSALPMKAYDASNAARNSEDPLDALKKGMGYRQ